MIYSLLYFEYFGMTLSFVRIIEKMGNFPIFKPFKSTISKF